jgi:glycosyltransferase involved in cell wall biosynthesis
LRVSYFVSRFPHVTETFIVRELNVVADEPDIEADLGSLYPPTVPTVHPSAERWVGRAWRPSAAQGLAATAWWLVRRPLRLLATAGAIVAGHARDPGSLARALATLPLAAAHARALRADHVHAHFATWPALAAWVCHRLTGVTYSFTAHAHDIFNEQTFLARKARDATFVVPISEYNRAFLEPYAGSTPMHVVHCGIDPTAYAYRDGRLRDGGPVRALCVASLQEYKGHQVLIRALALSERVTLDLVGGGELKEELERLAAELGVADRVRFHGNLTEDEVARLLGEAQLFVLASVVDRRGQMDGIPVALMEALACGVPTVSTRLSGIPDLVRDGETGLLAEPGDPRSLHDAIERTLADPAAADARAMAGRGLVEEEFDVRRTGARMAELFRSVSARAAAR